MPNSVALLPLVIALLAVSRFSSSLCDNEFLGNCEFVNDDEVRNWTSTNFPDPYDANSSKTLEVTVGEGYKIEVTVQKVDVDGEHNDFLSIKPSKSRYMSLQVCSLKCGRLACQLDRFS